VEFFVGEIINIRALKYTNIIHYEWQGELIKETTDYIMVLCKPGRKLKHHTKCKTFTINNTSLEFFSLKEGFTVAMEIDNEKITSYYCNIAKPSVFSNNSLSFVDLDLDLVKQHNEDWRVLDIEEFENNSTKYNYPLEIKEGAIQGLEVLKNMAKRKVFPFDGTP
jgi:protein associated with RNAse G/E